MSIITRILKGFPLTWTEVDQNFTDLDNLKAPKASPSFTGIVSGITKAMVGLGNADDKSSATIRGEINSGNVTTALGFTPENAANKGVANGYAGLDGSGKVPSGQLPSYVDDVLEYASFALLPTTGESGKIYVLDTPYTSGGVTSAQYRWGGSSYIAIVASPGTTDAVAEGTVNLFFTAARALAATVSSYLSLAGGTLTGGLTAPSFTGAHNGTIGATTPSSGKFTHAYSPTITLTDASSIVWDVSTGQVAKVTLGGNRTFNAPTNLVDGAFYSLNIIQDGTGSRTATWNSVFAFTGGVAPTLSTAAGSVDEIAWRYDGTKLREVGRSLGSA